MVRCVVGSILHGGPTEVFLVLAMLHNWCNKSSGMYYPVYGIQHIKQPLLLIGKAAGFLCRYLSGPLQGSTPYNRK